MTAPLTSSSSDLCATEVIVRRHPSYGGDYTVSIRVEWPASAPVCRTRARGVHASDAWEASGLCRTNCAIDCA